MNNHLGEKKSLKWHIASLLAKTHDITTKPTNHYHDLHKLGSSTMGRVFTHGESIPYAEKTSEGPSLPIYPQWDVQLGYIAEMQDN
jgi:hypothetical protein